MSAKKFIPLAEQPAYKEAMGKVVDIGRALSVTTARLEQVRAAIYELQNRKPDVSGAIDRAMALVTGGTSARSLVPQTMNHEVERLESEERALREGLQAANQAAANVASQLSREIGRQARDVHVKAVKAVREALIQLCAANKAEAAVRNELSMLGYDGHGLPYGGVSRLGEIDDRNGSIAYYYMEESDAYLSR